MLLLYWLGGEHMVFVPFASCEMLMRRSRVLYYINSFLARDPMYPGYLVHF